MNIGDCWNSCLEEGVATLGCLNCIFASVLNIVIRLGGLVAFIFLVIGGFRYLTAGGDPKKTEMASNTITYAVFGLVLLVLVYLILVFIKEFTGVDVTTFEIGASS